MTTALYAVAWVLAVIAAIHAIQWIMTRDDE